MEKGCVTGRGKKTKKTAEDTTVVELLAAIDEGIAVMKVKLKAEGADKTLLTDLVRLLQLRKEVANDAPRQISVRWIAEDKCSIFND